MKEKRIECLNGVKDSIAIALGYLSVSFSFGMLAAQGGLPVWAAVAISMTNLTSAGQFAGMNLMLSSASLFEIGVTTLVINLRYMLMSLSLSQKIEHMPLVKRMIIAFGITDEIFTVSSTKDRTLSFWYLAGLILLPYIGWATGTLLGACAGGVLPDAVTSAMGIMLYAMFLAIIIPASKKQKSVAVIVLCAVILSCILKYTPMLNRISSGWAIIIVTLVASALGATLFPRREEDAL